MHNDGKKLRTFYKVMIAVVIAGFILMVGLVVTGLTLARMSRDAAEPVEIPVEAMISLSPTYGGANTLVNITGMGFPPNSRVSFHITPTGVGVGTQPHGEALSNAEGMFSVMFAMPAVWPDGSEIKTENLVVLAMGTDATSEGGAGVIQAVADFHYLPVIQPEISISPTAGKEGTTVTVTVTDFPANQQVGVYLGTRDGSRPLTQSYTVGTTDAAGQLVQTFTVPENWPDGTRIREEQLEIVARTNDEVVRASAGFDYEPFPYPLIAVSPNFGGPDTPVSITGDGFPAGSHVLIKLGTSVDDAAGKPAYVEIRADLQGNISLPFTMPGFWPGGLPILNRDIVVLGTDDAGRGYGWMGFAYLRFAAVTVEQGSSAEATPTATQTVADAGAQTQQGNNASPQPPGGQTTTPQAAEAHPSISLTPATGGAGTVVQVNGAGFPAILPLTIRLGLPATGFDNTVYGSVVSDASGNFAAQFTMPETWADGTPIIETNLVVVMTNGDGAAKAGADFLYVPATDQEITPVDVCDIRGSLATGLGLANEQVEAAPADVVDPASGSVYAGCALKFTVTGQPPLDMLRAALLVLGWQEDVTTASDGPTIFRSDTGLLVIRVSEGSCAASAEGETCAPENTSYIVTLDYVKDTASH